MVYHIEHQYTATQLAQITGGTLIGTDPGLLSSISVDSRDDNPGGIFLCLVGERFDGHDYIKGAAQKGAVCVITAKDCDCAGLCEIRVENTERALGDIASAYRRTLSPLTVAVTGSVGKTTTKQFIYAVLSQHYQTHRTEGNYNNLIGLPETVLEMTSAHEAAVLEMGMNHRGEIARLSSIAMPDIAVITNIGNSHIEYLGTREGIRDAKMEIVCGLKPNGALLLNADEPLLSGIATAQYIGFDSQNADYRILNVQNRENAASFDLVTSQGVLKGLEIPVTGEHNVFDAAVACAVGLIAGLDEAEIRRGLASFTNTGFRQHICHTNGGVTLIEDCYNASPESMKAAIRVLSESAKRHGGRTVAILGDMRELGEHSAELHRQVGAFCAENRVDILFTFGQEAMMIAAGAMENGLQDDRVFIFRQSEETEQIGATLRRIVRSGDTVLLKASRAIALERLIPYLNS